MDTPTSKVIKHANKYINHWQDKDDQYWLNRLIQEVGEAASVLANDHDDPLDWEIMQISSIALNWLRKRSGIHQNK